MVRLVEAWLRLSENTYKKAEEHKRCADLATENQLLNSAVSRYYYYCLLLAKAYIIANDECPESYFGGSDSHRRIHENLHTVAQYNAMEAYDDVCSDLDLLSMRDYRVDADYKGNTCFIKDKTRFSDFFNLVTDFVEALNELKQRR